ncbi:MAG: DUF222 domain-containing protein [Microbacterium sp.]|uniref:HNH endonuclease signature motif containing protein n=1 Tax=Microbacterium sp. TaxID=51671 RepID=UPI0039E24136
MYSNLRFGFSDADAAELADVVHEALAAQREAEAAQARLTRALARAGAIAHRQTDGASADVKEREMALRSVAAELGGTLRVSDRSAQRQIDRAETLVTRFPATLAAWEAGRITRGHVYVITDLGLPLPDEALPRFEQTAVARCEQEVPGRVRAGLAILAERLHPRTLGERHRAAREGRCVRDCDLPDAMAALTLIGPAITVHAMYDRLTRQAVASVEARARAKERLRVRTATDHDEILASDPRTMDQLRADILTDMVLTAQPGADPTRTDDGPGTLGAIRATVQVVVPALTLLGVDDHPADLVGHAPIDADTARRLAGAVPTAWARILTHPVAGAVLATDTRFAEGPLRRHLRARDSHCRFPGCRVPAVRCEIDHTVDHAAGGPTRLSNLAGLCRRHHSMKQFTAWRVRQLGDGVLEWTSPLGEVYIDDPPAPTVHFVPDGDPPPF